MSMSMSMSRASTHFVGEKVAALDVATGLRVAPEGLAGDLLPLVASGGWDNQTNHVALHLPLLPSLDERALHGEFRGRTDGRPCELSTVAEAEHEGDVAALRFVSAGDERLLVTASSAGGVLAFRVSSSSSSSSTGDEQAPVLARVDLPQWAAVFGVYGATALDVSESGATIVSASAGGALAWLALDETMSVATIANSEASRLPLNAVKLLGRDTVAASAGSAPGSQLRIWDIAASNLFPVTVCSDPKTNAVLTSIETHPTRPELLITGSDDGRVCLWDRRRLDSPFRSEAKHQRAVRAVKLHASSPRYLFSAGDDGIVNCWDFHHGRRDREPVEYERRSASGNSGFAANGFGQRFDSSLDHGADGIGIKHVAVGAMPWSALAIHAESDTLVAGSDAQSLVIVQRASKWIS